MKKQGKYPVIFLTFKDVKDQNWNSCYKNIIKIISNEYYDEIIGFMRIFLGGGLKDNLDIEFSVITGILRIAQASIFSGMNNLEVRTVLDKAYSDKFGLLEEEVKILMDYYQLGSNFKQIKNWYNGYTFGNNVVYNPWSIINFAKTDGELQPYWVNTSDNLIIQELIKNGKDELKEDLELLLSNKSINKQIYENIIFPSVPLNPDVLWSFLLFSGYLTFENKKLKCDETYADLKIPNAEVRSFFKVVIFNWFKESVGTRQYNKILNSLISGDIKTFSKAFKDIVINSFSYFDVSDNEPENFITHSPFIFL